MNPDLNKLIVKRHLYDSWGNLNTDSVFDNIKASFFFKREYIVVMLEKKKKKRKEKEKQKKNNFHLLRVHLRYFW